MTESRISKPPVRIPRFTYALIAFAAMAFVTAALVLFISVSHVRLARAARARLLGFTLLSDCGVVLQKGRADCGPAALSMAVSCLGGDCTSDLMSGTRTMRWGWTPQELVDASARCQVKARVQQIQTSALSTLPLPSIVLWGPHYVVLEKAFDGAHLVVLDPTTGRLLVPIAVLAKEVRKQAVVFERPVASYRSLSKLGPSILESRSSGVFQYAAFQEKE